MSFLNYFKRTPPVVKVETIPAIEVKAHQAAPGTAIPRKRRRAPVAVRAYNAAMVDRLTSDFLPSYLSANAELRYQLKVLRGRSNTLAMNEPYTRYFIESCVRNMVGHDGLRFKCGAMNPKGIPDKIANDIIKAAFSKWGEKKNCTVTKRKTWVGAQKLICRALVKDGEVFVRIVRGFDNPFKFAVQILEPDYVDENYNVPNLPNGNRIIMGVELNPWGEPVAYYILKQHPGDYYGLGGASVGIQYEKIPANDMIHVFIQERPEQTRGVPWIYVAMARLNQLGAYEEAELIAARLQSCKMGFLTSKTDQPIDGDDEDSMGNTIIDATPGQIEQLPPNVDFKDWNPTHPNANMPAFEKAMLRGIAAGIGENYNLMAQDLEGVNFSSIRAGTIEQREQWKMLQVFFIEDCANDIYEKWLEVALLTPFLAPLPYSKFDKFNQPLFKGRRWEWVDPEKDMRAKAFAVLMKWKTNTDIIEDMDGDPDEVWAKLKEEKATMDALGLEQSIPQMLSFLTPPEEADPIAPQAKPAPTGKQGA